MHGVILLGFTLQHPEPFTDAQQGTDMALLLHLRDVRVFMLAAHRSEMIGAAGSIHFDNGPALALDERFNLHVVTLSWVRWKKGRAMPPFSVRCYWW